MHVRLITALFASAATLPQPAAAQRQPLTLTSEVKVERTVVEDGHSRRVLEAPTVVVPGDRLVFAVTYRNTGAATVSNFVLTNPLPAEVALTTDGAAQLEVSVDGGRQWGRLAKLTVPDGKGGHRPALPSEVSHVRWALDPLPPGAGGTLTFHAVVR